MTKIKSLDDLRQKKQQLEQSMDIREKSDHPENLVQIKVAMATCGIASGARTVMNVLVEKIKKENISAVVTQTGCMGYCYAEPTVEVTKPGFDPVVFSYVDVKKAEEIVDKYILNNELIDGILPPNYQTI
ncbi:MAG: (2Fe-2S) ferredoxin domain-containing protein [Bacteroidales bacterium]|jgi:NADP-reducing hydrogenase subunit HndB